MPRLSGDKSLVKTGRVANGIIIPINVPGNSIKIFWINLEFIFNILIIKLILLSNFLF